MYHRTRWGVFPELGRGRRCRFLLLRFGGVEGSEIAYVAAGEDGLGRRSTEEEVEVNVGRAEIVGIKDEDSPKVRVLLGFVICCLVDAAFLYHLGMIHLFSRERFESSDFGYDGAPKLLLSCSMDSSKCPPDLPNYVQTPRSRSKNQAPSQ
jgi:hypothetical protein